MKYVLILVALIALVLPMLAMTPEEMMNDTHICKILVDLGSSMQTWAVWQDNATGMWTVQMTTSYRGISTPLKTYYGDEDGFVVVDLT